MVRTTIVDTGALIASINKKDQYHRWAQKRAKKLPLPFLTCEAVLSEVWFLLRRFPIEQEKVLRLLEKKEIVVDFDLSVEIGKVAELLRRYKNGGCQEVCVHKNSDTLQKRADVSGRRLSGANERITRRLSGLFDRRRFQRLSPAR